MIDKPALRARLRAARDAFLASGPSPISPPPAFLDRLHAGIVVASYRAVGSEADPALFDQAARAAGATVALPHVTKRAEPMRFLRWDAGDSLEPSPMRLSQPRADAPELAPDVIVTPLLGFDRARNRLGQGAGFYDRAFARYPAAWRIGLAWSAQEVDDLPTDPWDMPLELIVTERAVIG